MRGEVLRGVVAATAVLALGAPASFAASPTVSALVAFAPSVTHLGDNGILFRSDADGSADAGEPGVGVTSLVAAGDLNGDGRPDVLERRALPSASQSVLHLYAHDEASGRLLWDRVILRPPGHALDAYAALTGRPGRPGVVLLDYSRTSTGDTINDKLSVSGMNGIGRELWSTSTTGTERTTSGTRQFRNDPVEAWVMPLRPGASDVVVVLDSHDEDANATGSISGSASFLRVSAADGTKRTVGSVHSDDGYPAWGFVPDQSGDGYDDIYGADTGSAGTVTVFSGATGAKAWSAAARTARTIGSGYWYMTGAGNLTGARRNGRRVQDLVVHSQTPAPISIGTIDVPDPRTNAHGQAVLLAGGTGIQQWVRAADATFPVNAAGSARTPALAVALNDDTGAAGTDPVSVIVTAVTAAGDDVWTATVSVDGTGDSVQAGAVGDVNADGTSDIAATTFAGDAGRRTAMHVIDGATGRVTAAPIGVPFLASFDGRGDDLAQIEGDDDGVRLSALDGRTGVRLFAQLFARATAISAIPAYPRRAKRADLLLGIDGPAIGTAAVLSPSGTVRWRVDRPAGRI
jgi:hypothetical protein